MFAALGTVSRRVTSTLTPSQYYTLASFLHIKTKALNSDVAAARLLQQKAAKARKKGSLQQAVADDEVNETSATSSLSKLALNQGKVVEHLCAIYFNGLKHGVERSDEPLVNAVVKGLTVFGSRINMDVIVKLMKVFKALLVGEEGDGEYKIGR